ncbi:hypothetical protein TWF694_008942 [Orbilia ellipsospora]|uniref:Uncharacterized protein n=1 Tax=Orbilia ellipsospora TaxID=2528407 RepID=A0AAV9XED9_9PEZI
MMVDDGAHSDKDNDVQMETAMKMVMPKGDLDGNFTAIDDTWALDSGWCTEF